MRHPPGGDDRAGQGGGAGAQLRELGVEDVAGARGRVAVAVAGDALQGDDLAGRVAVRVAARRRDGDRALGGHAVQRQLPAEQSRGGGHGLGGDAGRGVRAEEGDAGRHRVVALRLRPDDRLVDAARTALEHLAVAVDEEVVADVVPAVRVAVVLGDAEHDRRRIARAVLVDGRGVVDEGELDGAVARVAAGRHRGCPPRVAGDDRRGCAGRLGGASAGAGGAGADAAADAGRDGDEVQAQRAARGARQAQLQLVRAAGPQRVGGALAAARVGCVVAVGGERDPVAPRAAAAAHAHLHAPLAAQPDDLEAARGAQHAARASAAEVGGADGHAEAAHAPGGAERRGAAQRGDQGAQAGGEAEPEGSAAGDRRTAHGAEASHALRLRNPCMISCRAHRTRNPRDGSGLRPRRPPSGTGGGYAATISTAGVTAHSPPSQRSP